MSYLLLSGPTGLLGEYLLKDLLIANRNVAVLCRHAPGAHATDRIEDLISRWEAILGFALPRPMVIHSDITEPRAGVSDADIDWMRKHCDSFLHNAASLTFDANRDDGEPWRSNLLGTQNAIEVCKMCEIETIFHVSTAYVCGRRSGRILESELDCGQSFATEYEASKCASELAWKDAAFANLTILRPAIIVGDSETGYTSTYHGFYAPLKSLSALLTQMGKKGGAGEKVPIGPMLAALGLTGTETKNFVPVDWVSRLIVSIVNERQAWNSVYHLTPEHRVKALDVALAIQNSLDRFFLRNSETVSSGPSVKPAGMNGNHASPSSSIDTANKWVSLGNAFAEQVSAYQEYWRDDPVFDASNRNRFAATKPTLDLSCPVLTQDLLEKLCDFALEHGFGWPKRRIVGAANRLADWLLEKGIAAGNIVSAEVQLNALGPGGLQVTIGRNLDGNFVHEIGVIPNIPCLLFGFIQLLNCGSFDSLDEAGLSLLQYPTGSSESIEESICKVQGIFDAIDGTTNVGLRDKVEALI